MIIYPKIELQDGKVVQLKEGQLDNPIVYDTPSLLAARNFVELGAQALHIVDLDGVVQGGKHNAEQICSIIDGAGVPVNVAGGIRTMSTLHWWMDHGADKAILGTAVVNDPQFVNEACAYYPDRIIVSIDSRKDVVVVDGWTRPTSFSPLELARTLENVGVSAIIFTDIESAHELPEASFAMTTSLACELDIPVISSGVVRSIDDISTLCNLPNIYGAVIGRALFDKEIDLTQAIDIAKEKPTQAQFI